MNIDSGVYRGVEIEIGLFDGCDGQMGVSLSFKNKKIRKYFPKFEEAAIREAFNLPKENKTECGEFVLNIEVENRVIFWNFRFSCLKNATKYNLLASIFRGIDRLWKICNSNEKQPKKEAKEPEVPTQQEEAPKE